MSLLCPLFSRAPLKSWNHSWYPLFHSVEPGPGGAAKVKDCISDQPHSHTYPAPEVNGAGTGDRICKLISSDAPGIRRAKAEAFQGVWEPKRAEQGPGGVGGVLNPPSALPGGWSGGGWGRTKQGWQKMTFNQRLRRQRAEWLFSLWCQTSSCMSKEWRQSSLLTAQVVHRPKI